MKTKALEKGRWKFVNSSDTRVPRVPHPTQQLAFEGRKRLYLGIKELRNGFFWTGAEFFWFLTNNFKKMNHWLARWHDAAQKWASLGQSVLSHFLAFDKNEYSDSSAY